MNKNNLKSIELYKVNDSTDSLIKPKTAIFDLPFRIALVGRSGSGKTSMLVNLVASPFFYGNDFDGEDIFIISGSLENDEKIRKLIKYKEIPDENVFNRMNEEQIQVLYDFIKEAYKEDRDEKRTPPHRLIIFDDVSFSGGLKGKEFGVVSEMVCNCRKLLVSLIFTAQKYTQLSTTVRTNLTGAIFYNMNNKELDLIETDWDYGTNKKEFREAFRLATHENYDFFVVNLSNPRSDIYSSNFQHYLDI